MNRQNITPRLYNTAIGGLLRRVGKKIKAGQIQAHPSAAALVAYFEHAKIPDNAWNNVLGDLVSYASKENSYDGRSNVFFDKTTDSESDDE